ncbi:MAG: hypothetical protein QOE32_7848 [Pseudonocardiales bacterium]|jgi:hypothetical protein|nr:hypothetical protein [Pseudonocardiales bacterium]
MANAVQPGSLENTSVTAGATRGQCRAPAGGGATGQQRGPVPDTHTDDVHGNADDSGWPLGPLGSRFYRSKVDGGAERAPDER